IRLQENRKLIESEKEFNDRRNRVLNHLLARFSESFNDYVYMLYTSANGKNIRKKQNCLIEDKIAFLKEYPTVSRERGMAYNELEDTWNTENVSGLQKRICRLTGIENYKRRDLFCYPEIVLNERTSESPDYSFKIPVEESDHYLISIKNYKDKEALNKDVNKLYSFLGQGEYFTKDTTNPARILIKVVDNFGEEIARSHTYFTKEETADNFIKVITKEFSAYCEAEGMYLFENHLLRPRFKPKNTANKAVEEHYKLLPVCLGDGEAPCCDNDPYSFRLWAVLPFWPERFRQRE